jgi:lysine 6-dehydrogenase
MTKIVVLGCGAVGRYMAIDLCKDPGCEVVSVDVDQEALERLAREHPIQARVEDLSTVERVMRAVTDADLVIGSVPYSIGYVMLEGVIRAGKNIVDISYFLEDPFGLDDLAKEMGVTAVVDCGLAPFEYKSPFPVLEVLEEYAGSARRVEDGKVVVEPMLSETATIDFEGIGPLACLNSDGLRTLIRTMDIPDMFEKTLRYPGHRDVMHIFKDAGFLNLAPIQVEGASVRPTSLS